MWQKIMVIVMSVFAICCSGESMDSTNKDRQKWDSKYTNNEFIYGKEPALYLKESISLLPKGKALDIAAGEGRNAVFLAEKGWQVDAVDISPIGLKKAQQLAAEKNSTINTIVADLTKYEIAENSYDVIVNFYYLQRDLFPQIRKALKVGGVIVFETFTVDHLQISKMKRAYCLEKDELKKAFTGFEIIEYKEITTSNKAIARLIARKKRIE